MGRWWACFVGFFGILIEVSMKAVGVLFTNLRILVVSLQCSTQYYVSWNR